MLRQIFTLFRGAAHNAAEDFTDKNSLLLLQQQMRDSRATVVAARRAVAVATAQNQQDVQQLEKLIMRIADLERRAISALKQEKSVLAEEAAEMIALLEAERVASETSIAKFSTEISRLRSSVQVAEKWLCDLQRGQRIATATDKAQQLRKSTPQLGLCSLGEAENTLKRLQERQNQIDLASDALDEMDDATQPARLAERLAEAGCGAPMVNSTSDVLARLRRDAISESSI